MLKQSAIPTASRLILELLTAIPTHTAPAAVLIRGAAVFGFDDNAVRVALTRLRQRGLVEGVARGIYRIGPEASATTGWISTWRSRAAWLVPWHGDWLAVSTDLSDLPRSDQKRMRQWLQLRGFRQIAHSLYLRPANLDDPWTRLGGPPVRALTGRFVADDPEEVAGAPWQDIPWNNQMERALERLRRAQATLDALPVPEAARLAFVTGSDAIATIVREPLLPEPWVDSCLRQCLIDEMTAFDRIGKRLWLRVMFPDEPDARLFDETTDLQTAPPRR